MPPWSISCNRTASRTLLDLLKWNGFTQNVSFPVVSVANLLLGLVLQYADEAVLRVLVEHEITEGTMAKAGSCRDLSVDGFIKSHLSRAAGKKHPVQDEIPLHSAGSRNDTVAVRCLLETGADPNIYEYNQKPTVLRAAHHRNLEMLRLFFDHGADVYDLWRSCDWLESSESTEWDKRAAELLLPRVSTRALMLSNAGNRDRLMNIAALCGSVSVVKRILEEGSHGDTKPWGSRTFLHDKTYELQLPLAHAAKWGHMDVVALMLDYGADPSASGRAICSGVLESAIGSGDIEMVKLLLDRGLALTFSEESPIASQALA